jgi:hypothetical protein
MTQLRHGYGSRRTGWFRIRRDTGRSRQAPLQAFKGGVRTLSINVIRRVGEEPPRTLCVDCSIAACGWGIPLGGCRKYTEESHSDVAAARSRDIEILQSLMTPAPSIRSSVLARAPSLQHGKCFMFFSS